MAITVQGQTSGDTNATPQTTSASFVLIYDPAADGECESLRIINDDGSNTILVQAERWAEPDGVAGIAEVAGNEEAIVRGLPTTAGPRKSGKVWVKSGSGSCEVRWMPI